MCCDKITYEVLGEIAASVKLNAIAVTPLMMHPYPEAFRSAIREGKNASMEFLENTLEAKLDPAKKYPWAKTAIVVAVGYSGGEWGQAEYSISRYAQGADYHNVIRKRLDKLAKAISKFAGERIHCKPCVDTAPVCERALGSATGIGVWGEHSGLIVNGVGPLCVLGVLLCELEITSDTKTHSECFGCGECRRVCPTNALSEKFVLDARKCLAYWTIEHKGVLPDWVKKSMGKRLFGCDTCVVECSRKYGSIKGDDAFEVRELWATLGLRDILKMTEEDFARKLQGSPVRRAKIDGLKRNAAVVAGNTKRYDCLEELYALTNSENEGAANAAKWACDCLGED